MLAVETKDLCKTYSTVKKQPGILGSVKALFSRERNDVHAVCDVSMQIGQGELVGFLGPNGAGKTTTLKMLTGILHPTSGEAHVLGHLPSQRKHEMLKQISLVMGNKNQLWWDLPAWDSFVVMRELYEVPLDEFDRRVKQLGETLGIMDKVHTQVRKLSLGERMKCELVAALLHQPKVVFLDEPTIRLDVVSQRAIRDFLKDLHRETGCTILLTSHYMQDVQALCDRVIVIDKGAKIFDGTLDGLSRQFSDRRRILLRFSRNIDSADLVQYGEVVDSDEASASIDVARDDTPRIAAKVLQDLPVEDIAIEDVDVEEIIRKMFTSGVAES